MHVSSSFRLPGNMFLGVLGYHYTTVLVTGVKHYWLCSYQDTITGLFRELVLRVVNTMFNSFFCSQDVLEHIARRDELKTLKLKNNLKIQI